MLMLCAVSQTAQQHTTAAPAAATPASEGADAKAERGETNADESNTATVTADARVGSSSVVPVLAYCLHPGWVDTDMGRASASATEAPPLTVTESVASCIANVISVATLASHQGKLVDWTGKILPW
jgi:hypothetical protein